MTAIEIARPGGPEVLRPTRLQTPQPKRGEVLIRIFAAGVNRPDILQRKGNYAVPGDASPLPGLEAAGKIAALGEGVEEFRRRRSGLRPAERRRLCGVRRRPGRPR